jgi:hypothetical protein
MARVKMNSPISTQPVIKGPAVIRRMGLIIRNTIIASLYHMGAFPKKFFTKALNMVGSSQLVLGTTGYKLYICYKLCLLTSYVQKFNRLFNVGALI